MMGWGCSRFSGTENVIKYRERERERIVTYDLMEVKAIEQCTSTKNLFLPFQTWWPAV